MFCKLLLFACSVSMKWQFLRFVPTKQCSNKWLLALDWDCSGSIKRHDRNALCDSVRNWDHEMGHGFVHEDVFLGEKLATKSGVGSSRFGTFAQSPQRRGFHARYQMVFCRELSAESRMRPSPHTSRTCRALGLHTLKWEKSLVSSKSTRRTRGISKQKVSYE